MVRINLTKSFPAKTEEERQRIEKDFYHYLCDLFVETVKMFTISKSTLAKRITYDHFLSADEWFAKQKSFVLTIGHFGNYEWFCQSFVWHFKQKATGPYRQFSNKYFDQLFTRARTKFGTFVYPTHKTFHAIKEFQNAPIIVALANDQSAPPDKSYWTQFLNQDTTFFTGPDRIAQILEAPVVYGTIERVKRGYYHVSFQIITENSKSAGQNEIVEQHARLLEKDIQRNPAIWLWSHKRWKFKKEGGRNY